MSDQPQNPTSPDTPAAPEAVTKTRSLPSGAPKLQALRAKGNAFPNKFQRDNLVGDLIESLRRARPRLAST